MSSLYVRCAGPNKHKFGSGSPEDHGRAARLEASESGPNTGGSGPGHMPHTAGIYRVRLSYT